LELLAVIGGGAAGIFSLVFVTVLRPVVGLVLLLFVTFLFPIEVSAKVAVLPRIGPLRIAVIAFFVGLVARAILMRQPIVSFPTRFPTRTIVAYIAVLFATTLFSIEKLTSIYHIVDQLLLFFFFYLFWRYCRDEAAFDTLKNGLYLGAAIVCLFAVLEALSGFSLSPSLSLMGEQTERLGIPRIRSTFYHPIALGTFINLVLPFVVADLIRRGTTRRTLVLAALALALIVAQVLTVSRIPWIIMPLEVALVFVLARPSIWRAAGTSYAVVGGIAAGALILALLGVNSVSNLFGSMLSLGSGDEASSEYYRIILTRAVLDELTGLRWIVGFGPGTFHVANIEAIYAGDYHVLEAPDLHYVRVLADSGLLGITVFLCMLSAFVWLCGTVLRRTSADCRAEAAACLAAVGGFIVVNSTVSMFYTWPLALVFWFAVARAAALRDRAIGVEVGAALFVPRPSSVYGGRGITGVANIDG
jgi:hypothetical protein